MRYVLIAVLATSSTAEAQQQPVPSLKTGRVTADYQRLATQPSRPIRGWQVFKGAKECTQEGGKLTCDNGYSTQARP
jgi:hypothetical protein